MPASETGINFRNDIVGRTTMFMYLVRKPLYRGGVSIGDINNDGLPDILFFFQGAPINYTEPPAILSLKILLPAAGVDGGNGIKNGVNMGRHQQRWMAGHFVCKSGFKRSKPS